MQKRKWKFNIIDIIAVALIAVVLVFVATKVLDSRNAEGGYEMVPLTYEVIVESQPTGMYEAVQKYLPSNLLASGAIQDAEIVAVEARPTLVCSNGEWVEDPNHVDLVFTVKCEAEKTPVLVPTIGGQEIRVGREIILKTQYLEFSWAKVLSVSYGG